MSNIRLKQHAFGHNNISVFTVIQCYWRGLCPRLGIYTTWDIILANSTHIFTICSPKSVFSEGGGATKNILPYMQMGVVHGICITNIIVVVFYSHVVLSTQGWSAMQGVLHFTSNLKSKYAMVCGDTKRHAMVVVQLSLHWLYRSLSLINFSLCSKPQKLHRLELKDSPRRKTRWKTSATSSTTQRMHR